MPWRPVLLPQERTAHLSSTLKTLSWRAALAQGTDRGRPHHLCSRGNGVWGGSQEVKVQMGRVAGDAPHLKSRCRSSGETSKTKESFFHCQVDFRGCNLIVMCGTLSSKLVTSRCRDRQYSLVRPRRRPTL